MPDKAMTKREDAIGRACREAFDPTGTAARWDAIKLNIRKAWVDEGLAAVACARRIDTCETCKHQIASNDDPRGCCTEIFVMHMGDDFGCNRHEPKGE